MSFKTFKLSLGAVVANGLVFMGSTWLSRESIDIPDLAFSQMVSSSDVEVTSQPSHTSQSQNKPALDLNDKGSVIDTLRAHGCTVNFPQKQEEFMKKFIDKVPRIVLKKMSNKCFDKNEAKVMLERSFWRGGYYWSIY